jgi:hypothetical protein
VKPWLVCLFLALLALASLGHAQSQPTRDPQALAVIQQSITAMGGTPGDSTATGSVTTTAGSTTESGTITILTRGTDQSSEQIQTTDGATSVYSRGSASTVQSGTVTPTTLEQAVATQSADFPLPLLVGMVNDPDAAYAYVGLETLNGVSAHHVQLWNSFASVPQLSSIASFSIRDIWLDASSALPLRISYTAHLGQDAAQSVNYDVLLSNYSSMSGVQYPLSIQKDVNGTPWASIVISNVVFNTGLTDANFPVN